jgi:peptidoglycan hydrolase CwlO-like protein
VKKSHRIDYANDFSNQSRYDMTRAKEPAVGTTGLPNYKSPSSRIIRSLRTGYDNIRSKVDEKSKQIQSFQGKLRDTQESRDEWKVRAKDAEAKVIKLQDENNKLHERLKKKTLR